MATITAGRTARGTKKVRGVKKAAMFGAAATTAVAMAMGSTTMAPRADAALTVDGTTTGPLFWLISQLGLDSVTIPGVPVVGSLTVNLDWMKADANNLYNAANANTFAFFTGGTFYRPAILGSEPTGPALLASGPGTIQAIEAWKALMLSAAGETPEGYTPLTASGKVNSITGVPCEEGITCVQGVNQTGLPLILLRDLGLPNGGINARFQQLFNLFGVDPVTPEATTTSSTGIRLNTAEVNIALAYDLLSDFPATGNLFSLANSLMATLLPTNLLGGVALEGTTQDDIITNVVSALSPIGASSTTTYGTLVPTDLPLLEALRLPVRLINLAATALGLGIDLPTPIADALQPALEILVNIGYTDVQTPTEGGTYNRTYTESGVNTPWLSVNPLTPAEWAKVPGDVFHALIDGIVTEIHTLLGIAPPTAAPAAAAPSAARVTAAAAAAESESASDEDSSAGSDVAAAADDAADDAPSSVTSSRGSKGSEAAAKPSRKSGPSGKSARESASSDNDGPGGHGVAGSKRARSGDAA